MDSRRLAMSGMCGLALAWALILAFVGGWKIPGSVADGASPLGNGTTPLLVGGAGMMALMSLGFWFALIGPRLRRGVALRLVHVAATLTVLVTLGWGIFRHDPRRDPFLVAVVVLALALSWAARRAEARPTVSTKNALRAGRSRGQENLL
jgi:hypothetical protein